MNAMGVMKAAWPGHEYGAYFFPQQ
jgi:hypothetical protein